MWKYSLALALVFCLAGFGITTGEQGGSASLFNGTDLCGWVPVNCGPGTFTARDGMIVTTGIPTALLRTERQYENFELELEWRHMKSRGNSGVFLWGDPLPPVGSPYARGIEVQVLDPGVSIPGKDEWYTAHGDVFPVLGAKMTPTGRVGGSRSFPIEDRVKPSPDWNHYRIVANDGVVRLSVNGKEVTVGRDCSPRKGYLCLESEGSECHFRNLRIKELPSTHPKPEEVADQAEGFTPLYNGVDLAGWKAEPGHAGHWAPKDWILAYDGKSEGADKNLWTVGEYGDFVLVCDWRWTRKPVPTPRPVLLPSGDEAKDAAGKPVQEEVPDAGDSGIYLRGDGKSQVNIWCWPAGSGEVWGYRTDPSQPPEVRAAATPKKKADKPIGQWNRFIITMRGDRLTVNLNGEVVIDNAQLPGVPARGPIALQHHGDPIEFANIFVRPLGEAKATGAAAEPVVEETRAGGESVIRITPRNGVRKVYRIDLSQKHSPASEPNALLKKWESYRFGAFVCFNTNQFSGSEHCKISDPKRYNPQHLDIAGWIAAFKGAGMTHAVLTTRHTSGFLLWDSATTEFDVANSGNTTDVCREFVQECRRQGLAPAFYYCLWGGKRNPRPDARSIVLAQLYELATQFGEIPYFWLDMMNWAPPDLTTQEIYDLLKTLQPNAVVQFNQHVQDGSTIRYFPTDVVNGELVPPPAGGHNPVRTIDTKTYYLPFDYELCSQSRPHGKQYDPLGPSCWFTYGEGRDFAPSRSFPPEALAKQIRLGWDRGAANALLATAPDYTGRMRPEDVEQLRQLGRLLQQ